METTADNLTLEAYAALPERDDRYVTELVRGRLVREPRPGERHGDLQATVAYFLKAWVLERGAGKVYVESGFILSEDPATVRGPDVAVVLEPRGTTSEVGGWTRGAPDLAVEVLSPSDPSRAVQRKVLDYLEAGARRVWIVDPATCTVTVRRPDGTATVLGEGDVVTGEDVLPGFTVGVDALFAG